MKTSDEIWDERQGDMRGVVWLGKTPCAGCQHSTPDFTCNLTGQLELEVCLLEKECPNRKPRPPKTPERIAWEEKELEKAYALPEREWRKWRKEHPDYGFPWYDPDYDPDYHDDSDGW